jgi:hypothetical protein
MLQEFYINALIGLICLWLGYRLGVNDVANQKRKRFRNYLDLFAEKIQTRQMRDVAFDWNRTATGIHELEAEILEVRQYIRPRKLKLFNAMFESYKNVRFTTPGTLESNATNERAKAELLRLLCELKRLAT